MKYKDIRLLSDQEKINWYERIGKNAKGVIVKEHKSGFPAITIQYKDICLLTDILSVEEWSNKIKKGGVRRMTKKPKFQEAGKCPNCGSENLDYGDYELEGETISYEFTCDDCGTYSKEYFNLTYCETIIEGQERR